MEYPNNAHKEILLNTVSDGIFVVNKQSEIVFANHVALSMLGYGKQSLLGQNFDKVLMLQLNGELVSIQNSPIQTVLKTGSVFTSFREAASRYTLARSDRSILPIHMTILPYSSIDDAEGVTIIFHDRTADEKIDQAKSEFVAMVSHQLRTPINIISWYVEKLLNANHGDLNQKQRDYLQEIYKSNRRVIGLVQAIVNVSRTDLNKLVHKHEAFDISVTINKIIEDLSHETTSRNITVSTQIDDADYYLQDSDQEFVKTIIKNILLNAIRYSFEGSTVRLIMRHVKKGDVLDAQKNISAHEDGIFIAIIDSGIGIPDEEKSRIFTKLFRASNVHTLDVTGVGLGLYVAISFAKELGGDIWFDSEVRRGSNFSIYLPNK